MISDSAAGVMRAALSPWAARAAMSSVALLAKPLSIDALVNRVSPVRKTRRRDSRSAMRPPSSRPAAGHHQVGGDEPLQVAAAQVQGLTDRRQRGVDDRDVEHDEDLRGQGDGQHRPRLAWAVGLDVVRVVGMVRLGLRGDVRVRSR